MSTLPHIPVLRRGRAYESLDQIEVKDHKTGEVVAKVSTVNAGIVRKDLAKISEGRKALNKFTVAQLMEISAKAGEFFLNGTLPLGDKGHTQSGQEYIELLSRTSGLPWIMVKRNMAKIHYALTHMQEILNGLSRGLDFSIIDKGQGEQFGTSLSFFPTAHALGLVMPSNSPAVNSLWLPSIALKTPVVIKPGKEEPWTPYRLIEAFIAAGAPAEAFSYYPTDHEGSGEILKSCGRALIFGDKNTMAQYANNPAIQLHGRVGASSSSATTASSTGATTSTSWPRPSATTAAAPASTPRPSSCRNTPPRSPMRLRRKSGPSLHCRTTTRTPGSPASPT